MSLQDLHNADLEVRIRSYNTKAILAIIMQHRKDLIAQKLGLIPVPFGGYFKETFRSPETVQIPGREGSERNVFTTIYFMMSPEQGGKNCLLSNKSDTIHYFHDGWPAHYILVSPEGKIE